MEIAITLTAAPQSQDLFLDTAAAIQRELHGALEFSWLAEGEAADLMFRDGINGLDGSQLPALRKAVASAVGVQPADWCVQPVQGRRKRMLIADMDSTIIGQECLDEMADLKGIKPEIASLTERAMRGDLDFEAALRERIRLLRGLTEADLQRVLDESITLNPGARTLVQTMKSHGAHTVLVSGGFTFFTSAVAARAGFAVNRANVFLWEGGHLSGVAEPILGKEAKLAALKEEAAAHGIGASDAIAVGDGANDLAMLKEAGLGIAYRAKPVVAAEAEAQVRHTDLTALLYFQGYTRDGFRG
ncbi:MAG: phosphoserine phosphatase SerB [Rhodomicrobium sp.]